MYIVCDTFPGNRLLMAGLGAEAGLVAFELLAGNDDGPCNRSGRARLGLGAALKKFAVPSDCLPNICEGEVWQDCPI